MFCRIKGKIKVKTPEKVILENKGISYEILISPLTSQKLENLDLSQEIELIIYSYFILQKNLAKPVFIGFLNELEKEFFELFISISGIGPKNALKALSKPISEIARNIENEDLEALKKLPHIGVQKSKEIIAKLKGKVSRFMLIKDEGIKIEKEKIKEEIVQEAFQILLQLQYKKSEAKSLIEKALKSKKEFNSTQELLNEIYRVI